MAMGVALAVALLVVVVRGEHPANMTVVSGHGSEAAPLRVRVASSVKTLELDLVEYDVGGLYTVRVAPLVLTYPKLAACLSSNTLCYRSTACKNTYGQRTCIFCHFCARARTQIYSFNSTPPPHPPRARARPLVVLIYAYVRCTCCKHFLEGHSHRVVWCM